jgi:fructokinase
MRIGIDLGGTKIEGVLLGPGGAIAARRRVPTPSGDYDGTVAAIGHLVEALEHDAGLPNRCTVGIGMPGAISRITGLIKNANSTCLNGRPFDRDVAARLNRPVRLANDANCLALSEATDGAAASLEVVFAAILGTGAGGGLVVRGRIVEGRNAIAGEWGHNPLPWPQPAELPGPSCYCGKAGCIETWVSGPAFAADHHRVTGEEMSAEQIAASTDPVATTSLARLADRIARSLATVVNIVDPDAIVLGGGLSNIDALYDLISVRLPAHTFSDGISTPILKALHGDSSGVRGAAWLWPAEP